MIRKYKYSNLIDEMSKHKDNLSDIAKLLGVTAQTVSSKLADIREWTIGEIETLCKHYEKDYYYLFKKD